MNPFDLGNFLRGPVSRNSHSGGYMNWGGWGYTPLTQWVLVRWTTFGLYFNFLLWRSKTSWHYRSSVFCLGSEEEKCWEVSGFVVVQSLSSADSLQPHGLQHARPLCPLSSASLLKFMSTESVMPSNHLFMCCPLLLPSIFPTIRVFSNELALHIREPKYWFFRFSISPVNIQDWFPFGFSGSRDSWITQSMLGSWMEPQSCACAWTQGRGKTGEWALPRWYTHLGHQNYSSR